MPGATLTRALERLSVLTGLIAALAVSAAAANASAEQPEDLLRLQDSEHSAVRADHFDLSALSATKFEDRTLSGSRRHAPLLDVRAQTKPRWPSAADEASQINPPVVLHHDRGARSESADLAWGLTGTGASIFTGALLFHLETLQMRGEFGSGSPTANPQRYRAVQSQLDQTRKIVVALYAVGGSMVTSGVVLLANDDRGVHAKLAPAWMHGGPAARLKVSF